MAKFAYQVCVTAFLLLGLGQATVLFSDPKDRIVEVNEWVQFDCTVHCGYTVGWYMAGYRNAIRKNNTVPGLLIKTTRVTRCSGSNQRMTHSIKVLATEPFNKSTFYCAAYERRPQENSCSCGTGGRCYSRPALLTVRMAPTVSPPSQTTGITPSPPSQTTGITPSSSSQTTGVTPSPPSSASQDPTSSSSEKKSSTQAVPEQAATQS